MGVSRLNADAVPAITPAHLARLTAGAYMDAGEPVVLLGDSGTGKTHLLIGLGLAACEQGRRVRYVTTAQLVNELVEANDDRMPSPFVRPMIGRTLHDPAPDPGPGGPLWLPRSQRSREEPGQAVMVSVWCPAVVGIITSVPRLVWRT